jgi:hypothetical protein
LGLVRAKGYGIDTRSRVDMTSAGRICLGWSVLRGLGMGRGGVSGLARRGWARMDWVREVRVVGM